MADAKKTLPAALLVTRNFPPLIGGMERLNQQVLVALQTAWETALCGPAGCAAHVATGTEVSQGRVKPLPMFLLAAFGRALRLAARRKPQWVLAGSGLTAPIAWFAARLVGARFAVYLHGLDIVAPSRVYRALWLPFIRRADVALVNSANTAQLASSRNVPVDRLHVLHPGTAVPALDPQARSRFRARMDVGQRPLLLSVGRLTRRKGLAEFVAAALPAIVAQHPAALLMVIGDEASDALHATTGLQRRRIAEAARAAGIGDAVRFLGHCDEATLSEAYQAADVHVFPVLDLTGDVEGFGMVALEAAAHGLSTVAFAVGGVPDAVRDGDSGYLVEPGDYEAFANAVGTCLAQAQGDCTALCRAFAADKTWPLFGERLRAILHAASAQSQTNGIPS